MEFFFRPKRLQTVQKEIAESHKSKQEMLETWKLSVDEDLKELIISLVSLDTSELAIEAYMLSDREMYQIAGYLPYNYFNVNMRNLFSIFVTRADKLLCTVLYGQWQNSYDNKECNDFICMLLEKNDDFKNCIKENHLDTTRMRNILTDQDIVIGVGTEVSRYEFSEKKTLMEKFEFFGIQADSKLYIECAEVFYTFCSNKDYLEADSKEMLEVLKKYEMRAKPLLKAFLINFLTKLQLNELNKFQNLARYFEFIAGDAQNHQKEYKFLFNDVSEDIIEKYADWINTCRVIQYFGNDKRSKFWKKYRFTNVQRYNNSNTVVMEFENYIAVEFLGQGPIYFYPKNYFNTNLKRQFLVLGDGALQQFLYHETQYGDDDRIEHRGYWQNPVEKYIIEHNITCRLFS